MNRIVNKEEMRVYWQLENWFEKLVFVVGVVYSSLFALGFIIGLIQGVTQ